VTSPLRPDRPHISGFAALSALPNADYRSLDGFLADGDRPGSHVLTDCRLKGLLVCGAEQLRSNAIELSKLEQSVHKLLPEVHITFAKMKRFLLGTHHMVEPKHLAHYVAELNQQLKRKTIKRPAHKTLQSLYQHIHNHLRLATHPAGDSWIIIYANFLLRSE